MEHNLAPFEDHNSAKSPCAVLPQLAKLWQIIRDVINNIIIR